MSRPLGEIEQQPCGLGEGTGCVNSDVVVSNWEWSSKYTNSKELEFLEFDKVFIMMLACAVGRDKSFVKIETGR